MDVHDKETRSRNMKAIRNRDTKPELAVRKLLHRNGFRFRISPGKLPGKPDIWMAKWNVAIFINGCFWHMHECEKFRLPNSRQEFWQKKLNSNKIRDRIKIEELKSKGIRILTIWECALTGKGKLSDTILLILFKTWLLSGKTESEIDSGGLTVC
ncbi:Very short patch repair protein [Xenorhabdus nematophila F1]|uniref:Very short patch repair endonuclease n=1 Tax=Xenorhabdus anantnagensis TaxID=3025875 RepID=A0ABT5LU58_9GAMM|nr:MULTISPECIES: DNA mismatch endonuclease Vsr [Xenorhabdus]MDC9597939.1 DNA mismatch endonuclease Vsr [Xenorhabdus anantnagensis]CCW32959.1 Very short patch repair protein [Xenorhabdus nematophila F1]